MTHLSNVHMCCCSK